MAFLIIPAVALGIWAAFFIVGYTMLSIDNPIQRVAFIWAILVTDVIALTVVTLYFPASAAVIFSCLLTKCLIWSIMNHRNIVHFKYIPEE